MTGVQTCALPIYRAAERFAAAGLPVFASRDWHPPLSNHFQPQGDPWPVHCVQGTAGAALHPDLRLPEQTVLVSKGMDTSTDGYSAFDGISAADRPLAELLAENGITHLCIGGLATDYCVRATVLDALQRGLAVTLLLDGIAGVNLQPGDAERAIEEMRAAGARLLRVDELEI